MRKDKKLSIAEEIGLLMEKLSETEKEDIIQSYLYLVREENLKDIVEELEWDITSTSVASPSITILIDLLLDFKLLEYSPNPGYRLTKGGKELLLRDISEEVKNSYSACIEKIVQIGDDKKVVKEARKKYIEKMGW